MAEMHVVTTLNAKRKEIESYIADLERDMDQARADLAAVMASLRLFGVEGPRVKPYMHIAKILPRRTFYRLIREGLERSPSGIRTTDVAAYVLSASGIGIGDRYLVKAIAQRVVQVLRRWERERKVRRAGKDKTAVVWALPRPDGQSLVP